MNSSSGFGSLTLFLGPMYSGKTSELNATLTKQSDLGRRVLKIFHRWDLSRDDATSYSLQGTSHRSQMAPLPDAITIIAAEALEGVDVGEYHVIGIDEAQFFNDLVEKVTDWVDRQHKQVFVAGLDGDYEKRPIGHTLALLPHCDRVTKLSSSCKYCISDAEASRIHFNPENYHAPFTKRLISDREQFVVGGRDVYHATCRFHHR